MRITPITRNSSSISDMRELSTRQRRLSSGKRINSASDDAAGLAISERLGAQLRSLAQASRNVDHGTAVTRIADGALSSQGDNLVRMRELAMQAANGTLSDDDRSAIQAEMSALREEVDRVSASTEFNGQPLLDGDAIDIQVGSNAGPADTISVDTPNVSATGLGLDSVDLSTQQGAQDALSALDSAAEALSEARGSLGAAENRMGYARNNIASSHQNLTASRSRVADADIGKEAAASASVMHRLQASIAVQKKGLSMQGLLVSKLG
jgi:flagellin